MMESNQSRDKDRELMKKQKEAQQDLSNYDDSITVATGKEGEPQPRHDNPLDARKALFDKQKKMRGKATSKDRADHPDIEEMAAGIEEAQESNDRGSQPRNVPMDPEEDARDLDGAASREPMDEDRGEVIAEAQRQLEAENAAIEEGDDQEELQAAEDPAPEEPVVYEDDDEEVYIKVDGEPTLVRKADIRRAGSEKSLAIEISSNRRYREAARKEENAQRLLEEARRAPPVTDPTRSSDLPDDPGHNPEPSDAQTDIDAQLASLERKRYEAEVAGDDQKVVEYAVQIRRLERRAIAEEVARDNGGMAPRANGREGQHLSPQTPQQQPGFTRKLEPWEVRRINMRMDAPLSEHGFSDVSNDEDLRAIAKKHLFVLLEDPKNADRPAEDLAAQAGRYARKVGRASGKGSVQSRVERKRQQPTVTPSASSTSAGRSESSEPKEPNRKEKQKAALDKIRRSRGQSD